MLRAPDLKFRPPREDNVQRWIAALFRKAGVHVGSTSQYRASRVEEGIPDLMCHAEAIATFFWFETKSYQPTFALTPEKRVRYNPYDRSTWIPRPLSPKQLEFRRRALACGVKHYWGGFPQAEDALIEVGLGVRDDSGQFLYRVRRPA